MRTLGPDYNDKIMHIIEAALAETGISYYANPDTGEINLANMKKFFKIEDQLCTEMWRKLQTYGDHCTKIRAELNMNPFSWENETPDRIKQYCQCDPWQFPVLRGTSTQQKQFGRFIRKTLKEK